MQTSCISIAKPRHSVVSAIALLAGSSGGGGVASHQRGAESAAAGEMPRIFSSSTRRVERTNHYIGAP